jgi:cyclophilin family peptidyl-prolyl cis-trans isomerase
VALWPTATPDEKAIILRGLGQVGTQAHVAFVAEALLAPERELAVTASRALGMMARRKLSLDGVSRDHLATASDVEGWGVAYALANIDPPRPTDAALVNVLVGHSAPRWMALRALSVVDTEVVGFLSDPDPAVRIEAVRMLAGKRATEAARRGLIAWVRETWPDAQQPRAPLLQALRQLAPLAADDKAIAELFARLPIDANDRIVRDEAECLQAAVAVRVGGPYAPLLACGGEPGWPVFKRRELAYELIAAGVGPETERAAAATAMWGDRDVRVRGLGAAAAVKLGTNEVVLRALDDELLVAGPAIDALSEREDKAVSPELEAALVARGEKELTGKDPELLQGILTVLETNESEKVEALRSKAKTSPLASVRKAAGGAEAGGNGPRFAPPAATRPVHGAGWRLKVTTTRGVFHIDLEADRARVAVGALVTLADQKFFDGLIFHRVVPNFVVQGGDPTGSGWGGPGFLLPAERSSLRYLRGTVGMADSGLDTAGSQWFVTLQESPHLEGRYTIVGRVPEAEMPVVDRLLVGDAMLKVEVLAP